VRLADSFTVLVVGCLVVLVVGGWLAYDTHVDPGTVEETQMTTLFERSGGYDHQATVAHSTELYPEGTILRSRPVYFTAVAPELEGVLVYRYGSPHDDEVTVTTRSELVTRSVDRTGETEYWRTSRTLAAPESTQVAGAGVVRVPVSVNVSALEARVERIGEDLGGDLGRPEATVRTTVRVQGTVDGDQIDLTDSYALRLGIQRGTYTVTQAERATTAVETTELVSVPVTHGPLRQAGSILVVLLAAGSLGGLLLLRGTGRLTASDADRDRVVFAADRAVAADWITTGALAGDIDDRPAFSVESLDALVDAAIDAETRVLDVPDRGQFLVVTDSLVYVYDPPAGASNR
jgi:hypothetical protein